MGSLAGLLELPNPAGARPRSVVLPCASQLRVPLLTRWLPGLFAAPLPDRAPFCIAAGGRACSSSRWRGVMAALLEFPARAFGMLLAGRCTDPFAGRFAAELPRSFPVRPAAKLAEFIVRTCDREAPAAGAVRATTARFCTDPEGRATLALVLAAPNELCLVGEKPTLSVTCAPFKEASVTWKAPRLMAWP
jgi:hypothetical protein